MFMHICIWQSDYSKINQGFLMKKRNIFLIILLILLYIALRIYRIEDIFTFSFDQYRDTWVVKQIIIDKKIILIGPQSSFYGIYYGPFWYYSLVPFYWIFGLNPLGGAYSAIFYGLITLLILLYIAKNLFSWRAAIFSGLIYDLSYFINMLNRDCRNDPPLIGLSAIILFFTYKAVSEKKKFKPCFYILLGFLAGLGWHFHFAAIIFFPLIAVSFLFFKVSKILTKLGLLILGFLVSLLPLFIFELRHDILISRNFLKLTENSSSVGITWANKLIGNFVLVFNNFLNILTPVQPLGILRMTIVLLALSFLAFFVSKSENSFKKSKIFAIFLIWIILPIIFFSFYTGEMRYYFFLLNFPVFILIMGLSLEKTVSFRIGKFLVIFFVLIATYANIKALSNANSPRSLKLTKEAVDFIKRDSRSQPIFIDYFSKDNFKVGFEYLKYYYHLNTIKKQDLSKYPSYLIYVPAKKIDVDYDKVFGDIGIKILLKKNE